MVPVIKKIGRGMPGHIQELMNNIITENKIKYKAREINYFEFEFHRFSLFAWHHDLIAGAGVPAMAVTIDRHYDFLKASDASLKAFSVYKNTAELFENTDKLPAPQNYDFISYAIYDAMCSDVLVVACEKYHEIELRSMLERNYPLVDKNGGTHFLSVVHSLNDLLAEGSPFETSKTYESARKRLASAGRIILDIDLDYFSYQSPDNGVFARSEEDIEENFAKIAKGLAGLLDRVTTIAVARETICCGGEEQMLKIKKCLKRLFLKYADIDMPL